MKRITAILMLAGFFTIIGFQLLEAKKKEVYVISREFAYPQVLDQVVVKKKKIDNGVLIKMTSSNEAKIQELKTLLETIMKKAESLKDDPRYDRELLYRKGITSTLTPVKKGFQLEMVSDNPESIKLLKKIFLPILRRSEDITGEGE